MCIGSEVFPSWNREKVITVFEFRNAFTMNQHKLASAHHTHTEAIWCTSRQLSDFRQNLFDPSTSWHSGKQQQHDRMPLHQRLLCLHSLYCLLFCSLYSALFSLHNSTGVLVCTSCTFFSQHLLIYKPPWYKLGCNPMFPGTQVTSVLCSQSPYNQDPRFQGPNLAKALYLRCPCFPLPLRSQGFIFGRHCIPKVSVVMPIQWNLGL